MAGDGGFVVDVELTYAVPPLHHADEALDGLVASWVEAETPVRAGESGRPPRPLRRRVHPLLRRASAQPPRPRHGGHLLRWLAILPTDEVVWRL